MSRYAPDYRELPPPDRLAAYVARAWTSTTGPRSATTRVVPDGSLDLLAVRPPSGEVSLIWVGAMPSAEVVELTPGSLYAGVRIRPGAAPAFLDRPASELTGLDVDAAEVWSDVERLRDRLSRASDAPTMAHVLLAALAERLGNDVDSAIIRWAARLLAGTDGAPPALGPRQLRRRFTAAVGLGPKRFSRIARLWRALRRREFAPETPWAQIGLEVGCHDQAHLIHEFVELAGATPGALAL